MHVMDGIMYQSDWVIRLAWLTALIGLGVAWGCA